MTIEEKEERRIKKERRRANKSRARGRHMPTMRHADKSKVAKKRRLNKRDLFDMAYED